MLPGQVTTVTFFVNVNKTLNSGSYPISLTIKHSQGSAILNIDFIVSPKARFELVNLPDSSALYPGAANAPLKATIKNMGSATAQTITTKFLGGNNLPGVKSNTVTSVGNVETIGDTVPGQTFTTTFIVNVDPTTPVGDQATTLEIDWMQDGKSFSQTVIVPFHLSGGPYYLLYYNGIPLTYVMIIALLVAGAIAFVILRRRKLSYITPSVSASSIQPLEDISQGADPAIGNASIKKAEYESEYPDFGEME